MLTITYSVLKIKRLMCKNSMMNKSPHYTEHVDNFPYWIKIPVIPNQNI